MTNDTMENIKADIRLIRNISGPMRKNLLHRSHMWRRLREFRYGEGAAMLERTVGDPRQ